MSLVFERIKVEIEGLTPLLVHNSVYAANPLSELTKIQKSFTGKRKKTELDHEAMFKLDWIGSLYCKEFPEIIANDQSVTFLNGKGLCLPYRMIKAMIQNAAKNSKEGTTVKQAVIVAGDALFNFPDKKEFDQQEHPFEWLYNTNKYTDISSVTVQRSRVMRTRGIFPVWSATFYVQFLPQMLDFNQIQQFLTLGGQVIGLGDYRPEYGRFQVKSIEPTN